MKTLITRPRNSSGTARCTSVRSTPIHTAPCTPNTASTAPATHAEPASARPTCVSVSSTRPVRSSTEEENRA